MTYEQWERVKEECHNAKMVAFCGLSKEAQDATRLAQGLGATTEVLNSGGIWATTSCDSRYSNNIYRIHPSWPGPAKPEPVVEYEDVPVILHNGLFAINRDGYHTCIALANVSPCFAGYVMPDGKLRTRLTFDRQKDDTYRLRVPKAVRMVKEVAK